MSILAFLSQAIQLIVALSIILFVHELGHFLMARLFGMRVDKFFLFWDTGGRALCRWKSPRSGTEYGIGWLPIGGYCKIKGMIDEQYLSTGVRQEPAEDEFRAKPAWQRFLVLVMGVVFGFLLAVVIFWGITFRWGEQSLRVSEVTAGWLFSPEAHEIGFQDNDRILRIDEMDLNVLSDSFIRGLIEARKVTIEREGEILDIAIPTDMMQRVIRGKQGLLSMQLPFVIDSIMADGAAANAGLKAGDHLLMLDSSRIADVVDARITFAQHAERPLQALWLRAGDTIATTIVPSAEGQIGVLLAPMDKVYPVEPIRYSFWESMPKGCTKAVKMLTGYVSDMKYLFTPEGATQMGGLISMGKLFSQLFDAYRFWYMCGFLSIAFAFMNLIPLPALDGGHLLFTLVEMVTRRRVSDKIVARAQIVGLLFILLLMLWANVGDIVRLFVK